MTCLSDGHAPSKVRYHSRPAQLDAGGVTRTTGLSPAQQQQLEHFITTVLGGKAYVS